MRKLVKSIIFVLIFCFIWNQVFKVLWIQKNSTSYFYDEPKNTLDAVYIGASNVYVHFNSTLAFQKYGFATGILSAGDQPSVIVKYLIKEAQKYQNPKVFIIDITQFSLDYSYATEGDDRNSIDAMKFSKNRLDAIDAILKYTDFEKNDPNSKSGNNKINYYFSYLTHHNSWKYLAEINFVGDKRLYKSYYLSKGTTKSVPFDTPTWPNTMEDLPAANKEVLLDLINYIQDSKINALFVVPKRLYISDNRGVPERINTIIKMLETEKFKVINFNTVDDLEIDYKHDLHNFSHLNVYGSTKYTLYFSKYLHDNYKFEDHREDKRYSSWNEEYQRFKNDYKKYTNKNFDDLLEQY